jgi:phosphonatase-like hydrolase
MQTLSAVALARRSFSAGGDPDSGRPCSAIANFIELIRKLQNLYTLTKMVVFDMAGTTVNENNVVYKCLMQAINEKGYDLSLDQVLAEGAGKEKLQAIKSILSVYAEMDDDDFSSEIYQRFILILEDAYDTLDVLPQNNALALFQALKQRGILVILNTGYNRETAEKLLNKLGWQKGVHIDGLVTASDVFKNRPNPDMIWYAMKEFGITDAAEVMKVGDSIIDIEEGQNAGCLLSIGITTGAHTLEQLQSAGPNYIISNLMELLPLLESNQEFLSTDTTIRTKPLDKV